MQLWAMIETALAVFRLEEIAGADAATVAWAARVREAFGKPENDQKGVLSLDGVMVERLHLAEAERVLALDAAFHATRNM